MEFGEKKVEYIELIYDLIFVYFIGRSNDILHSVESGFFSVNTYITFFMSLLVILQIWYLSTLFINRYGDNSIRNFIGLFINMYLIYYMASGTRTDWEAYYLRYNIAWGLILVNLAVQYLFVYFRARKERAWEVPNIKRHITILLIQAVLVFVTIPFYSLLKVPLIWVPIAAGFLFTLITRNSDAVFPVNFEHLTERVMLFVVLTFGEMIISVAAYFEGAFSFTVFYFSLMTFLIVAGLFLSYGYLYNFIIDRERVTTGTTYMLIHVVLLAALCNITVALSYMHEPEIDTIPKVIFLVVSFLIYFLFLLILGRYSREHERLRKKILLLLIACGVVFLILMGLFYRNAYISVAVTVLFIYAVYLLLVENHRLNKREIMA